MSDLPDTNPKTRVGRLKPQTHAIPPSALISLGMAMEEGERCYGLTNWRDSPVSASVYLDAIDRHKLAWWDGQDRSPSEVGVDKNGDPIMKGNIHHLAHIMACCAILIDAEICGTLNDDRPPPGPAAELIMTIWNNRIDVLTTEIVQAQGDMPVAKAANDVDMAALKAAIEPFAPPLDLGNA